MKPTLLTLATIFSIAGSLLWIANFYYRFDHGYGFAVGSSGVPTALLFYLGAMALALTGINRGEPYSVRRLALPVPIILFLFILTLLIGP